MKQYILINRLKVQNANAVAGFTWGFPAITHFLGFTHNLSRKLIGTEFSHIRLSGCAVVAHEHHVHTYGKYGDKFTQSRNPPYLHSHKKAETPPIIEEGKMNMTVSLLIGCEGNVGNRADDFIAWLHKTCCLQRLAGGTVLEIAEVTLWSTETNTDRHSIKRRLLPGFVLMDRSAYLSEHFEEIQKSDQDAELLDAWFDFVALKQKARPKSDLITKHFRKMLAKSEVGNGYEFYQDWKDHLHKPYNKDTISNSLKHHFAQLEKTGSNKNVLDQWRLYLQPNPRPNHELICQHLKEKSVEDQLLIDWESHLREPYEVDAIPSRIRDYFFRLKKEEYKPLHKQWRQYVNPKATLADWEYLPKPKPGFLVPIMTGYKAISPVYDNSEIANTRDNRTPVCFVESVHSVGEWLSVHRLRSAEDFAGCLWQYHYEENWYLCKQSATDSKNVAETTLYENPDDELI